MKKITITKVEGLVEVRNDGRKEGVPEAIECYGQENMDASDGYHTFTELYDHRITLYIALCQQLRLKVDADNINGVRMADISSQVWRSKLHSDGSSFEGWFILGIGKEKGKQITYHLPLSKWNETEFATDMEKAPEWDGHTPADVLERLKNL